jgi:serine/threonine protein kinase
MTAVRPCPHCGTPLPADAPAGVCPQCVLRLGLRVAAAPEPASPAAFRSEAKFVAPEPAVLAKLFAPLEILELLGQGGMGAVYKARQPKLDRLVALKVLPGEVAADPPFAERFVREAQALARLNHPGIVAVYDFGEAGGFYYFLMEFVDGVNLRQLIQSKTLEPRQALAIVPQICEALQYAHEEGIVHRDIKPENILMDKKNRVKIADFGLAKLLAHSTRPNVLTGSLQVMGTPHYMSPEQMERPQEVDHRADIYSLGVVFYEMLTGELPLGRFAPPSQKAAVDARLDEVVLRALEREPVRRYQHASDVKTEVERITGTPQGGAELVAPPGLNWDDLISLLGALLGFLVIALGMVITRSALPLWGLPFVVLMCYSDPSKTRKEIVNIGCSGAILAVLALAIFGMWLTGSGEPLLALFSLLAALLAHAGYEQTKKAAEKATKDKDPKG